MVFCCSLCSCSLLTSINKGEDYEFQYLKLFDWLHECNNCLQKLKLTIHVHMNLRQLRNYTNFNELLRQVFRANTRR